MKIIILKWADWMSMVKNIAYHSLSQPLALAQLLEEKIKKN